VFKKILVANRGEIALRVMRTANEMGISTVAVYSEADRRSPHVQFADEAYCIGSAPSSQSYLLADKIIEVAKQSCAEAIHPGYGFLSENAGFSQKVKDAGLTFIGPDARAIEIMGSKLASKEAVAAYDVPLVPGTEGAVSDPEEALEKAREIGFPVLIKASAGGGGKGMRVVNAAEELEEAMKRAISEAESAFGDGAVFVEKFVEGPRHIEIQILGDSHGNIVHLFERECSIQRRHQKVVEEAPSSILSPEKREEMGQAAVQVARSVNYVGAGTVEFLLDIHGDFYFLEMNTRLQVEHPVTEMISGKDLVQEQIRIAAGMPISFKQEELSIYGHAIELRVYAEDPEAGFLPDIGTLNMYRRPQGPGVRVDDGFEEGMEIPIYYDPMIAKLCTWGADRDQAIARMLRAIREYRISGIKTTLSFGTFAVDHEAFRSGDFDTGFVGRYYKPGGDEVELDEMEARLAAHLARQAIENKSQSHSENTNSTQDSDRAGLSTWQRNRS
jgi:propionyl-CoA carboxylase alpha chain